MILRCGLFLGELALISLLGTAPAHSQSQAQPPTQAAPTAQPVTIAQAPRANVGLPGPAEQRETTGRPAFYIAPYSDAAQHRLENFFTPTADGFAEMPPPAASDQPSPEAR